MTAHAAMASTIGTALKQEKNDSWRSEDVFSHQRGWDDVPGDDAGVVSALGLEHAGRAVVLCRLLGLRDGRRGLETNPVVGEVELGLVHPSPRGQGVREGGKGLTGSRYPRRW